jgi:hypothetical protein
MTGLQTWFAAVLAAAATIVDVHALPSISRGELLYTTHCIACHSTQVHWRDSKRAADWESLKLQVRYWQMTAGLQRSGADVVGVARYLNDAL